MAKHKFANNFYLQFEAGTPRHGLVGVPVHVYRTVCKYFKCLIISLINT